MDFRDAARGPVCVDHPVLQKLDPHHCVKRPGHLYSPVPGREDPTVPATPRTIITPELFGTVCTALADADAQLLVEIAIESGPR
jgi:hypothetical protein